MKLYAFFLPQFHQTYHNDKWWGKGFTEWSLVRDSKRLFDDHRQPRVPSDGYFDLTNEGELEKQFLNAKRHGIDGFVIYHYWYLGEKILERPLDILLKNKKIDAEFSLCWANHSWTRSWKNRKGALDVLIDQEYEKDKKERQKHFNYLAKAFIDERYIRIDGKVLFHIYKPTDIPNLKEFISELREYFLKHYNIELHISTILTDWKRSYDFLVYFDSITFSQPALAMYAPSMVFTSNLVKEKLFSRSWKTMLRSLPPKFLKVLYFVQDNLLKDKLTKLNYDDVWKNILEQTSLSQKESDYNIYPSGFIDFDNSARYTGRATIMENFTPDKFGFYLKELLKMNTNDITFLYAWNEWSEGMYLQSDKEFQNERLEQVLAAKNTLS